MYKLDASGKETVLHTFTTREGKNPLGVIRDPAGNLFGVTQGGGLGRAGTVYKLDTGGKLTALYQFTGGADGGTPFSGVIRDSLGNIYGTTLFGGTANVGVVYMVATGGSETVLHTFTGTDGAYPYSGVLRDPAGNLYGTARSGGVGYSGLVYKIDAAGGETVVHVFTDRADGWSPFAGLTADAEGNLYGTTYQGGPGAGTLFKLDSAGRETLLHTFTGGTDGEQPSANVIRDSAGNLYGTTQYGGTANAGVVFKVDATGQETVLYSFTGGADGAQPVAGLVRDAAGNLFGTTENGGNANLGVVFELSATGQETVLHSFAGGTDGANPVSGLAPGTGGYFYGTTFYGGAKDSGVVYILTPAGEVFVIYTFTGNADGGDPAGTLISDSAGNFYGTTEFGGTGGAGGYGVVYKIDPIGNESVLYQFTGGADGGYPMSNLIRDSAGNLYGTAQGGGSGNFGVVFMLSPAGQETVLYNFRGGADGGAPRGGCDPRCGGESFWNRGLWREFEGWRNDFQNCGSVGGNRNGRAFRRDSRFTRSGRMRRAGTGPSRWYSTTTRRRMRPATGWRCGRCRRRIGSIPPGCSRKRGRSWRSLHRKWTFDPGSRRRRIAIEFRHGSITTPVYARGGRGRGCRAHFVVGR